MYDGIGVLRIKKLAFRAIKKSFSRRFYLIRPVFAEAWSTYKADMFMPVYCVAHWFITLTACRLSHLTLTCTLGLV